MSDGTPAAEELALRRKQKQEREQAEQERMDNLSPIPVGWSVLILIPQPEDTYESGVAKAAITKQHEQILSSIGRVVDMGPQAYADKRFGGKPWCKVKDFVMFRPNSGTRFRVGKREYRLLNDDSIEAVVPDPSIIEGV